MQSEFQDVYARSEFDVRNFTILEHEIDTGDFAPATRRMQRKSAFFAGKEAHFKKMLDARVIQPSISAWAGPRTHSEEGQAGTLVPGYRHLNKVMRKDAFPFPLIDECLDTLSGFAKLDANLALHQIKILALNRKKTVLWYSLSLCLWGLVCVMPLLPFQEPCQNLVLHGLTWRIDGVSFFWMTLLLGVGLTLKTTWLIAILRV